MIWKIVRGQSQITLVIFLAVLLSASVGVGQVREKVVYSFCSEASCSDGAYPHSNLVTDKDGNLYGTTTYGGSNCQKNNGSGCGVAFELSPLQDGTWAETVLYSFCTGDIQNCPDGANPGAGLRFDKAGNLYGTTQNGGTYGLGTVFKLSPGGQLGQTWTESVLWSFGSKSDGQQPLSRVSLDAAGNLYGTTSFGGMYGYGTVFQLLQPEPGGQWSENILCSFGLDPLNGKVPKEGVTFDKLGNLYGTTSGGGAKEGAGRGVVYKLSPNRQPQKWAPTILFRFTQAKGSYPLSSINIDNLGNLYGTASAEGGGGYGSVFRLTPQAGGHAQTVSFLGTPDGASPGAGVLLDGNVVYGTTTMGGTQNGGTIFKIQGRRESVLYSFCSQPSCVDGNQPQASLASLHGSLFGTTWFGGGNGKGVIFQISLSAPQVTNKTATKVSSHRAHLATTNSRANGAGGPGSASR